MNLKPNMPPAFRKHAVLAFKILTSLVFVAVILRIARASDIASNFTNLNLAYLLSLIPIAFIIIWISCIKWKLLLGKHRSMVSVMYLMSLYLLGYFFNNFLPSMVGGDAARGYYLGRRIDHFKAAYLSILLERLTGLFAMIAIVAVLALGNHSFVRNAGIRLSLISLTLSLIAAVVILFSKRFFSFLLRAIPKRWDGARVKLDLAHTALTSFRQHPAEFACVLLLSLCFHLLAGVNIYVACRALNITPNFIDVILVTPLIMLASTLPITFNGAGLWEASFVVFLSYFLGISESVAVSAALLLRFKTLVISGIGWFVYIMQRHFRQQICEKRYGNTVKRDRHQIRGNRG